MNFATNLLASLGMITLLAGGMIGAQAAGEHITAAFDRQDAAHDAMIAEHKAYLAQDDNNYVTDPMNGFDEEVYEASEQAKTASHANLFIANAYGGE